MRGWNPLWMWVWEEIIEPIMMGGRPTNHSPSFSFAFSSTPKKQKHPILLEMANVHEEDGCVNKKKGLYQTVVC